MNGWRLDVGGPDAALAGRDAGRKRLHLKFKVVTSIPPLAGEAEG